MSELEIPLTDLDFGDLEEAAVLRVLGRRWLSMGEEVQAFEGEFAEYMGVRHAIAVSNATAALHLSHLALGIGAGDEVIQPALNFVASANTSIAAGAVPVFADIVSVDEPTIDPDDVERRIGPKSKAIIVMHYGGYLCRMPEIQALCRKRGLLLIEDACHAVGARYCNLAQDDLHGRMAGTMGDIGCFSFFSNKNLVTGEGGMVVTDDDDIADRVRLLRSHGMTTLSWQRHRGHATSYDVLLHGFNYRLDDMRAALGRVQLSKLENNNRRRRHLTDVYRALLRSVPRWHVPFSDYPGDSACHLAVAIAPSMAARDAARSQLRNSGIQTSIHYPCIPDFTGFRDFAANGIGRSREFADRVVTLPLFPTMTDSQVQKVCRVVHDSAIVN